MDRLIDEFDFDLPTGSSSSSRCDRSSQCPPCPRLPRPFSLSSGQLGFGLAVALLACVIGLLPVIVTALWQQRQQVLGRRLPRWVQLLWLCVCTTCGTLYVASTETGGGTTHPRCPTGLLGLLGLSDGAHDWLELAMVYRVGGPALGLLKFVADRSWVPVGLASTAVALFAISRTVHWVLSVLPVFPAVFTVRSVTSLHPAPPATDKQVPTSVPSLLSECTLRTDGHDTLMRLPPPPAPAPAPALTESSKVPPGFYKERYKSMDRLKAACNRWLVDRSEAPVKWANGIKRHELETDCWERGFDRS